MHHVIILWPWASELTFLRLQFHHSQKKAPYTTHLIGLLLSINDTESNSHFSQSTAQTGSLSSGSGNRASQRTLIESNPKQTSPASALSQFCFLIQVSAGDRAGEIPPWWSPNWMILINSLLRSPGGLAFVYYGNA